MIRRRSLLLALPMISAAAADPLPQREIKLIVGSLSGSPADQAARAFAPFLERYLPRRRVRVMNVPGGAGTLAYHRLAAAPADASVLGWVSTPTLPARMVDQNDPTLIDRLRLLGAVSRETLALITTPGDDTTTIANTFAAERGHITIATTAPGTPPYLMGLQLQKFLPRAELLAFPSRTAARCAVENKDTTAAILLLGDAVPFIRDEKLSMIGQTSLSETDFPDWPTLIAQGIPLSAWIHRGLAAPAALPEQKAAELAAALTAVVQDPEFQGQAATASFIPSFIPGDVWKSQLEAERTQIARLWAEQRWAVASTAS